jgi:hypothetical protein
VVEKNKRFKLEASVGVIDSCLGTLGLNFFLSPLKRLSKRPPL